jgi:uncharacterized protein YndB with AHSA1/START domain
MTASSTNTSSTRVSKVIKASRAAVYQVFLDPISLIAWLPPDNMRGQVHVFDAREGGAFRISLTYQDQAHPLRGKTSEDTDTVQGDLSN